MSEIFFVLTLALLLDRTIGDPPGLWARIPHPVVLFGRAIDALDRNWNRERDTPGRRRALGVLACLLLLAGAAAIGWAIHAACLSLGFAGLLLEGVIVSIFLAQKSLAAHVSAVADGLLASLAEGRRAVSMIVGRDPDRLDAAGVSRAAIESLAENASDGVVAPVVAFLVAGLPGLLAYKMLNTADSMIGHLSARHREFGWAAARLDDVANYVPARLTAGLFALLGPRAREAWRAARRDGPRHRSVNAGWPEAAMAASLGLALGGPRRYGELEVDAPFLNAQGRRDAGRCDIARSLDLFRLLCGILLFFSAAGLVLSAL